VIKTIRSLIFIFAFFVLEEAAEAKDEKSIEGLRDAIVALAPSVDSHEAELISLTAHTTSRSLAREYRIVGPPAFQNFLIHIGLRQHGYCFDFARDIGARLKELKAKTLALHWGESFAETEQENNGLVVTARGQPFRDGIVIDAWRHGGRLFWRSVSKDRQNEWKENLRETALLQDYGPTQPKPQARTAPGLENLEKQSR
jgi:hypothetical protein